ncbi:MAG: 4-hydroxy-tetrahydrodipicolinate reductase [Thermaurantimonas sp.]|uniref:4-hydroxy-tetrahydrodipicolinate reductase n=1 Tax=Thermaurantimonas sp. TaxID=2681568 RepID=UPI00391D2D36
MKIILIGYGKMGKMIESLSLDTQDEIIARITKTEDIAAYSNQADVAIEFTRPEAAVDNIHECFRAGIPVVSGTTGWFQHLPKVIELAEQYGGALLYSSNFSIGVQLFFKITNKVSEVLSTFSQYSPSIREIHHTQKLDAPSGTAITLSQLMLPHYPHLRGYSLNESEENTLRINAIREGDITGIHEVKFTSNVDEITLRHEAFSRVGFAQGALAAARWIIGRKGVFTMDDMLNINF